jgi:beta-phosphoglucomutase family hydrolase
MGCGVLDAMTTRPVDEAGANVMSDPAIRETSPAVPQTTAAATADPNALKALGLPASTRGVLFDLDGVLTRTSIVHEAAWKDMFDAYLETHAEHTGTTFRPFTTQDYASYVDGKPRQDGTRSFLESRGIELPLGELDDAPTVESVYGLGIRKNELVLQKIRDEGVEVYQGSVDYLHAVLAAGLKTAVVSSSANTLQVIGVTGLEPLLQARVDAGIARRDGLRGKPAPDTFLAGAAALGIAPADAVVVEDAVAGVEAGRAGGFALVIGVDRIGQAERLREHGADIVVKDLAELLPR